MPSNAFSCIGVMLSKGRRRTAPQGAAWWPEEPMDICVSDQHVAVGSGGHVQGIPRPWGQQFGQS